MLRILGFNAADSVSIKRGEVYAPIPYEIYTENNRERAPLEQSRCLSGAYIGEENIYSDISDFEQMTETDNDIYISIMKQGQDFPSDEIISCCAKGKTPMLMLEKGIGSSQAMGAAKMCGSLNIPMFVEIKSADISGYECIGKIFREYAPNTVLVYGADSDSFEYDFPDEELVDWVGIDVNEKMKDGVIISQAENVKRLCTYFKNKAVMLNISVPNFSTDGCSYAYSEAALEIEALYSAAADFNNVGAVNYISSIEKNGSTVVSNCRITENSTLTEAFKNGCMSLPDSRYWCKTPFAAYEVNGRIIASNDAVLRLGIKGKFINSGYSEINTARINKFERKLFIKL